MKKEMLKILKELRADNPYPDDIFLERSHKDWVKLQKAISRAHLVQDGYFGSWGRKVWDNACNELERRIEDIEEEQNERR